MPAAPGPQIAISTPATATHGAASKFVSITFSSGYKIGAFHAPEAALQTKPAKLNGKCRYSTTFKVARSKVGKAKQLSVVVRFHGNHYLGATTHRFSVRVPQ